MRLVRGNLFRIVGLTFGIGRCIVMNVKNEFCFVLMRRVNDFIKFFKIEVEIR